MESQQRARDAARSRSWSDRRGAVFVEKLIVYLPLLLAFFLTWDLAELCAAKLVVERASSAAGRAAVVVLADDPRFYGGEPVGSFGGERRADIELAAGMILSAIPQLGSDFEVTVSDASSAQAALEVGVSVRYDCGLACVFSGTGVELASLTQHTYQGARYAYGAAASELEAVDLALASEPVTRLRAKTREPRHPSDVIVSSCGQGASQECKRCAEGVSRSSAEVRILGRLEQTQHYKPGGRHAQSNHNVLNLPDGQWTLDVNDQWVEAGVSSQSDFLMASEPSGNLVQTTGPHAGERTVYSRELGMLEEAGYVRIGDIMVHPAKTGRYAVCRDACGLGPQLNTSAGPSRARRRAAHPRSPPAAWQHSQGAIRVTKAAPVEGTAVP